MAINPLWRLALGIPGAGIGGLLGYAASPKANKLEGMARGAGMGYFAGTGLGIGAHLGDMAAPEDASSNERIPYWALGGAGGAAAGLGAGKMLAGEPAWESKRKFREELLALLQEEHTKLRHELRSQPQAIQALQKIGVSPIQELLVAKKLSDRKEYAGKHRKLRTIIDQHPEDFYIDSIQGGIAGITHFPSGFKLHAPLGILPANLKNKAQQAVPLSSKEVIDEAANPVA